MHVIPSVTADLLVLLLYICLCGWVLLKSQCKLLLSRGVGWHGLDQAIAPEFVGMVLNFTDYTVTTQYVMLGNVRRVSVQLIKWACS